jgi:hypothetical protein
MPDKEEIRKRRSGALMAQLNIGPDDRIFDMVPRQSGLHMVTLEKIIKVNLPDEIDPEIEFSDAPIAQILVANVGSRLSHGRFYNRKISPVFIGKVVDQQFKRSPGG